MYVCTFNILFTYICMYVVNISANIVVRRLFDYDSKIIISLNLTLENSIQELFIPFRFVPLRFVYIKFNIQFRVTRRTQRNCIITTKIKTTTTTKKYLVMTQIATAPSDSKLDKNPQVFIRYTRHVNE